MSKRQNSSVLAKETRRPHRTQAHPSGAPAADVRAQLRTVANGVVEASCLVAVVSIPLYFHVLTSTGYEPDKAILLRVFAAVAGGASLAAAILEGRLRFSRRLNPMLALGMLFLLAYILATALSIDPGASLWGSQGRQEGLWTYAAYFIFFVVAATRLRTVAQWQRLITAFVFGSLPAVVYGFLQQFGFDPIPTTGDPTTLAWPVRSTFGQHVFFGAYLVMVIPFTAARAAEHWSRREAPAQKGTGDEALLVVGAVIVTIVTFYIFMGLGFHQPALFALFPMLLAGYAMLAVLLHELPDSVSGRQIRWVGYGALLGLQVVTLVLTGARGPWLGFFAGIPVFALLLARHLRRPQIARSILAVSAAIALFVGVLNVPGGPLQPLRTVHGFSRLANITEGNGSDGSAQGRLEIWRGIKDLMVHTPSIGSTWGGIGRDLIGYGPETLRYSFQKVYPLSFRQVSSENWVWDRAHDIYLDLVVNSGLVGFLIFVVILILFVAKMLTWLRRVPDTVSWIIIAAVTAVASHLVEGLFGLETAVTLLPLWLLFGFAAGLPLRPIDETVGERRVARAVPPAIWYAVALIVVGAVAAIVSSTIAPHPALVSALWLLAAMIGVGGMAAVLLALEDVVLPGVRDGQRTNKPPAIGTARVGILAALGLALAVTLESQMQFETAAIAERAGATQLGMGNTSGGIGYLQEAVSANAYEPTYFTELGAAYFALGQNRLDSALPDYQPSLLQARTMDPQTAVNLSKDQLFALARDALEHARAIAPLDPDMYNNLGNLYLQWNKPVQALPFFVSAERLSVKNPRYIDEEALTFLQEGKLKVALAKAEQGFNLDRGFWFSYYALAMVDHQLGNKPQARHMAAIALYLKQNAFPGPPLTQIQELQSIQKTG